MKLNAVRVQQTLSQLGDAQAIPDDHPVVPQLNRAFGDHTFFLNGHGLHVVEPVGEAAEPEAGNVIRVATWTDADRSSLAPHDPEPTEIVVPFKVD